MNNSTKEQIGCDVICKSHSARTERDLYRICPSKLSKRELEDLYFALLENNLELKKTINVQQDKIKVLSTRLQRMTVVQKNVAGKEKDCCVSKAVISEQKESITDLKKTNERMAERIRLLNMRLCSAKQFLKRSPSQSTNSYKTCTRCSFKNSSMSALIAKRSDSNMRTTAVSCQFLDKDVSEKATRTVETETEIPEMKNTEKQCNENKCRTMMDELKEKIVNLQEELATSHNEYSQRIAKLESLVSELHDENVRVRSERAASEHALQHRVKKADQLQDKLRTADAKCNELNMELSIERRKVAELETGLKLANLSQHVVETIEQLAAAKEEKQESAEPAHVGSRCSSCSQKNEEQLSSSKAKLEPPSSCEPKNEVKFSKSDDSGYTELNKSCETDDDLPMVKANRELLKKITELQTQLDLVRISAAGETIDTEIKMPKDFESYDVETKDIDEAQTENAVDSASVMLNMSTSFEKNSTDGPQTAVERVRDQAPVGYEACASKTWEDYKTTDNDNMDAPNILIFKDKPEVKVPRDDEHNSLQIPGPIPVTPSQSTKDKKNYKNGQNGRDSNDRLKKKAYSEEKTVKIFENSKESYFNSDKQSGSAVCSKVKDQAIIANLKEYARDIEAERKSKEIEDKKQKNVNITHVEAKLADRTPTRDSIFVNKKKMSRDPIAEVMESTTSFYLDSVCTPPTSNNAEGSEVVESSTQVEENLDAYPLCESRATVCRCPALARRELSVFRSCSGTLRFRTAHASDRLRRCGCRVQTDSSGTQMEPPSPRRRDSATYTADAPNTYTVNVEKKSRATSPDNTDHEISSMTDLPSEKDAKSPRPVPALSPGVMSPRVLSPGEEKATSTTTDTDTMPTDYGSLSEGEMPGGRVRRLSVGERPAATTRDSVVGTSSEKMEATLQSISEELARCRQLLLSQRPREESQCGRETEELASEVHALRPTAANRRIVDAHAPTCVFTLHIGTLVLSDEYVVYSREKSLVLTWKFYSQNEAMTRVQSDRVVQFHFVTEYDVPLTDNFLDYMKHSDMAIILCEFGKQDEPFAVCSLPLREALLHANRRADMSLALVSTSCEGSRNRLGDEIGVLDLWCTLRVDVSLLPTIHRAMQTPATSVWTGTNPLRSDSKVIEAAVDDDISSERLSRGLDMASNKHGNISVAPSTSPAQKYSSLTEDDYQPSVAREQWSRYDDDVEQYRSSRPYRRSSQAQKSIPASDLGHKGMVEFENQWPSPAFIKSKNDMKEALERNVQQSNVTRWPKMDDDVSHIHSSIGSVKNLAARHQLSKLRWSKTKSSRDRDDSLQALLYKKDKGFFIAPSASSAVPAASMEGYIKDDNSDQTLSKLNNINKYIGVPGINKLVEASKKSVKYTDVPSTREPEKESKPESDENGTESIDITILWLALNEECEAMVNPKIQRLYVAYSFLGRGGADLETPFSLPKPKHYADKCYFNFKKTFHLHEYDLPLLGHMSRCRAGSSASTDPRDCIVFTLVSEPPEDPLGLSSCEDIGYAYLYLGDVLAYSGGSGGYTEVVGVRAARGVCGVLAVRVEPLPVLRRALALAPAAPA